MPGWKIAKLFYGLFSQLLQNCQEIGLLSLSNLAIYIKKAVFSGLKMISKVRCDVCNQIIKKKLAALFSDLPAINATVFS